MILKKIKDMIINIKGINSQLLYASAPISKFASIFVHDNEETRFSKEKKGKIIETDKKIKYNLSVVNRENL